MEKRSFSRRQFLKLSTMAGAGALVAACAPTVVKETVVQTVEVPGETVKETVVVEKEVTPLPEEHSITVAWHTGGEGANAVFSEAVTKFEDAYPNYTLEKVTEPWGPYMEKLLVMYASGTEPDAHTIPWGWYAIFIEKGGLLDIEPFAQRDIDELMPDQLWPAAWDGMVYKGVRRGLPRETLGMFCVVYNTSIFEEEGLETPAELFEKGEWTWEKYRELGAALTIKEDDRFERVGCNFPTFNEGFDMALRSWGHPEGLFDPLQTTCNLTDPVTVDFVNWLIDFVADGTMFKPGESQEFDWMASGRQAMIHDATFGFPNYKATWEFEWDFAPEPAGPGGFFNVAGYDFYGISARSDDPEGAWEFIKFQNTPEMTLWWGEQFYGLPFHQSVSDHWLDTVRGDPPPTKGWDFIDEMADASIGVPNTVAANYWLSEWDNKMVPMFRGDLSPDEVLPDVKAVVEEVLASGEFELEE